jgi:hypothetical protein
VRFRLIQNEIPRDDDHTAQQESLEWESPATEAFARFQIGFRVRILRLEQKKKKENKSQREAKKQTSRLGNRAPQASLCKAPVSGILALCFFCDGVRDSAISAI